MLQESERGYGHADPSVCHSRESSQLRQCDSFSAHPAVFDGITWCHFEIGSSLFNAAHVRSVKGTVISPQHEHANRKDYFPSETRGKFGE